jgi:hypothetical protein
VREQAQVIQNWLGVVEDFVRRGLTEAEALQEPPPAADPYPAGQRLHHWEPRINALNVGNLYRRIAARQQGATLG